MSVVVSKGLFSQPTTRRQKECFTLSILISSFIQNKAQLLMIHLLSLLQSLALTDVNGTAEGEKKNIKMFCFKVTTLSVDLVSEPGASAWKQRCVPLHTLWLTTTDY